MKEEKPKKVVKVGPKLADKLAALINNAAWTYTKKLSGLDLDDLRQDGWVAALRALAWYEPAHGPPTPYLWRAITYGMYRAFNQTIHPTSGHGHRPSLSTKGIRRVGLLEEEDRDGRGEGSTHGRGAGVSWRDASYFFDPLPLPDALASAAEITEAVIGRLRDLGATPTVAAVIVGEEEKTTLSSDEVVVLSEVRRRVKGDRRLRRMLEGTA